MAEPKNYKIDYSPLPGFFIARLKLPEQLTRYGQPVYILKNDEPAITYQIDPDGEFASRTEYLLGPKIIGWEIFQQLPSGVDFITYDQETAEIVFVVEDTFELDALFHRAGAKRNSQE